MRLDDSRRRHRCHFVRSLLEGRHPPHPHVPAKPHCPAVAARPNVIFLNTAVGSIIHDPLCLDSYCVLVKDKNILQFLVMCALIHYDSFVNPLIGFSAKNL